MGLANDAARLRTASVRQDQRKYLEMGLANDAARLRTASVRQDQRKYLEMGLANDAARLRTASVRQDQRKYLEMGLANDAATSPLPSPLRGEGRGEASVRQDQRQYSEAVIEMPLYELDRGSLANHLSTLYVPPLGEMEALRLPETLRYITMRLRREPDGCPWDRQ